jgi:hypothetical protein
MAQTKKKRTTKHRGNAAGGVEARGRTGRKLTDAEKGKNAKARGGRPAERGDRFDRPPTWTGAAQRSLIAVVIFVAVLVLIFKQSPAPAVGLASVLLVVYIPMSFYTDQLLYRRRQAKKSQGGGGDKKKKDAS